MRNNITYIKDINRMTLFLKSIIFIISLVWVLAVAENGIAAQSGSPAGKSISSSQANHANDPNNMFDTSAVPKEMKREWAGIQNKLVKEYNACTDDCGDNLECQEKCWNAYEFRLDREHKRIMHKAK